MNASTAAAAKVRLTRRSSAYWQVTFDNPPLNIVGPPEVRRLQQILDEIEADPKVKVVVLDSAVPGYFMAHYDLLAPLSDSANMAAGPTGMHPVPDFMARLSRSAGAPAASAARSRSRRICGSPAVRTPSPRNRGELDRPNLAADPAMAREVERYVTGLTHREAGFLS